MQDFEKALEKFLKKRDLVLKRMEDDKAENKKLEALLGCDKS